eukprot:TRINITY_DN3505_c3_g1_i2.p1 TRINITY_DN3505_c3_g1~~TRINITY_DN3505_c3_g1_i2.p1  ORF type:complete len:610 (-),score=167.10 TRINITY_DN3505_c3_g1_i2:124-1953(-)
MASIGDVVNSTMRMNEEEANIDIPLEEVNSNNNFPFNSSSKFQTNAPKFSGLRREFLIPFVSLMLVMFLSILDSTIVSTALPTIANSFNRLDLYAWVINAYLIATALTIPLTAQLSDLIGRKNLVVSFGFLFIFGSLLCGVSQSMTALVGFRAIQGLGAGPIYSACSIIIADIVPQHQRGRYSGIMGMIFGLATVGGPIFGGLIAEGTTWRLIFLLNLPIGIPCLVLIWYFLNYEREKEISNGYNGPTGGSISTNERSGISSQDVLSVSSEDGSEVRDTSSYSSYNSSNTWKVSKSVLFKRVNFIGSILLTFSILLGLLASSFGSAGTFPWDSSQIIGLFCGGLASLCFFFLHEYFVAKIHIFPWGLISTPIVVVQFNIFLIGFILLGCVSYLPIYFQVIRLDSPTLSGVKLLPLLLGLITTSIPTGFFVARKGIAWPFPIVGMALTTLGVGLMSLLRLQTDYAAIFFWLLLIGVGIGLSMQVLVIILQASVPAREIPAVISANSFLRTVGGIIGVQIFQIIIQQWLKSHLANSGLSYNQLTRDKILSLTDVDLRNRVFLTYNKAIEILFYVLIPLAGTAFLLSFLLRKVKIPTKLNPATEIAAAAAGL